MKSTTNITVDPSKRDMSLFAPNSSTSRVAESGLDLKPIGAINTPKQVPESCAVLVYNSSSSVAFVTFGDNTITGSGLNASNAIPVLPNSLFMLNSGLSRYIVGSAATLFAYTGDNQ